MWVTLVQLVDAFKLHTLHVTRTPAGDAATSQPDVQRAALVNFFRDLGGPAWTTKGGWGNASGGGCDWHGVTCEDGVVVYAT